MSLDVGFIGLGQIGLPMAKRLDDPLVYDVNPAATSGFGRVAGSLEEFRGCDVVCVMVRDDAQVREVVPRLVEVRAERASKPPVVCVHSTISVETATSFGDSVIDAPVSGGSMGAADGSLAIMVGGTSASYERAKPVLETLGSMVVHFGPAGSGTKAKLARNLLHFVAFTAVTEAQRLAESASLDLEALGRIVRHTDAITGGPGAIMLRRTAAPMAADDPWRSIFDHVRNLGEKDLSLALELAKHNGVDTPLAQLALERLASGLGLEDA